ncbi:nonsense-mediated mRNA decay protein 2-like [Pecten maximus]|uniref:nonsense-mediated mRNA decay protein 2-like n=1 Tax=Pecten maximus TaxID=6579 RepID=UPI001457F565|nr:nonsense-mediated mRNA decay protein 2-like [Pecten maximus]
MEEGINKWKAEKAVDFVNNIDDDSIKYITDLINNCNDPLELNIDELIDKCCNVLLHAAKNSLGINIKKRNVNNKSVASNKPWFDLNCKKARKTYRQCKGQYRRRRNEYFYNKYKESEKAYKYTMNKSIKTYKYDVRKKLKTMKSKNPRDYWKLLKGNGNRKPKGKIPLDTFFNFYKDLNASVDDGITDLHEGHDGITDVHEGHDGPINEFLNSDITKDEVEKAIRSLKNNKSCSDDNITNEYIKCSADDENNDDSETSDSDEDSDEADEDAQKSTEKQDDEQQREESASAPPATRVTADIKDHDNSKPPKRRSAPKEKQEH